MHPHFMAGFQFGGDSHKGAVEVFDVETFEMFLHALCQPQPAEQAAAADGEVEKGGDAAHGQRAGEAFELIELAGQIAAADQSADRGAGDHADLDTFFVQRSEDTDMSPATRCTATEGERNARFRSFGLRDEGVRGDVRSQGLVGLQLVCIVAFQTPVQHDTPHTALNVHRSITLGARRTFQTVNAGVACIVSRHMPNF